MQAAADSAHLEGEVPRLPFTAAQKARTETDALTGEEVYRMNPVNLTVTEEFPLDGHILEWIRKGGDKDVLHYTIPLSLCALGMQPEYRQGLRLSNALWAKRYVQDVLECVYRSHMHKCADTCKKGKSNLCRFRYWSTARVLQQKKKGDPPVEAVTVVYGKALRDAPGPDADNVVCSARDHPFVSNFLATVQVVLRCNCDVQCLAWTFGEVLKKLSESKSAPGLRSAAENIFLQTAKNAHVIVFYITTYISKVAPSGKGIFEALQKMPQVMAKKQAKMHANAATASVTSKRLERDKHVITALSQQLNRGRVLAFSDMVNQLIGNDYFSSHATWLVYVAPLRDAVLDSQRAAKSGTVERPAFPEQHLSALVAWRKRGIERFLQLFLLERL